MPETEEASEEVNPGELLKTASAQGGLTYMNSGAKAEENRSSAWVLLVVGILGMLVMILGITGVLPLNIGNPYVLRSDECCFHSVHCHGRGIHAECKAF
jgi:type IV secretory pathway component VirB8